MARWIPVKDFAQKYDVTIMSIYVKLKYWRKKKKDVSWSKLENQRLFIDDEKAYDFISKTDPKVQYKFDRIYYALLPCFRDSEFRLARALSRRTGTHYQTYASRFDYAFTGRMRTRIVKETLDVMIDEAEYIAEHRGNSLGDYVSIEDHEFLTRALNEVKEE